MKKELTFPNVTFLVFFCSYFVVVIFQINNQVSLITAVTTRNSIELFTEGNNSWIPSRNVREVFIVNKRKGGGKPVQTGINWP